MGIKITFTSMDRSEYDAIPFNVNPDPAVYHVNQKEHAYTWFSVASKAKHYNYLAYKY